ncbi:polymer-forming cytoskeletal protein [Niallia endozanthoxylica]|uniref:Polymer-forming cytoskeletal protein n=1 Tax=Niallia endozanthoxylica TaxID=2036016 RepID=A0A5J5HU31_9BACI|nr:polymer-forming cytoskeletal protein [Niallia endozanthoxylica]KAA9025681.1 polymer-forming cytoskeletal protein [Niallia endozanthoxylica]
MKFKLLLASTVLVGTLAACGAEEEKPAEEAVKEKAEEKTDVVTTASIVNEADALVKALSAEGTWIVATLGDITVDEEIVVAGEFHNKGDAAQDIYRKLAPYTQDEDHNVLERFTVTVPKMTVQSENFKVQAGTVKGDIYVEAKGFTLTADATIDGNVYYASEDLKASAVIEGKVTGAQEVGAASDVVTTASLVKDGEALKKAASKDGTWIFAILNDVTIDDELVVAGEFHDKNDPAKPIYRKFAPYTQDEQRNVLERFTLTVPKMTVQSENFKVQAGIVKGDVYVQAKGFTLTADATIDGNVYFASEDVKAAAVVEGKVTGATEVKK